MRSDDFKAAQSARFKGVPRPAEVVEKIRAAHARRSPEERAALSEKMRAANARRSPEERQRISEAIAASKRGKPRSPETIEKMRARRATEETRARMSAARRARPPHSEETRAKIAAGVKRARAAGAP